MVLHLTIGQPYRNHNGGNLVFGPDGALWIGVGDGGSADDPAGVAQDPDVLLGTADVGQDAREEVTVVDPTAPDGINFGWDLLEGTLPLDGEPGPALTDPQLEYSHEEGCSITGGHVYRGTEIESLQGWYLFGDFCGGWSGPSRPMIRPPPRSSCPASARSCPSPS